MAPASVPRGWWLGLAAVLVGAILAEPQRLERLPVICPFRRLTGLPCPTCGLVRSWSHTSRLHLGAATALHPFGPPSLAAATVMLASGRARRRVVAGIEGAPPAAIGLGVVVWLAFWVARAVNARG